MIRLSCLLFRCVRVRGCVSSTCRLVYCTVLRGRIGISRLVSFGQCFVARLGLFWCVVDLHCALRGLYRLEGCGLLAVVCLRCHAAGLLFVGLLLIVDGYFIRGGEDCWSCLLLSKVLTCCFSVVRLVAVVVLVCQHYGTNYGMLLL